MKDPWINDGEVGAVAIVDEEELHGTTDLSPQRAKIARLLAEGELGIVEIAEAVGVTRQSVWRWSKEADVKERVREINAALDSETYRTGLARKRNRIAKLEEMANLLERKIKASSRLNVSHFREYRAHLEQIARELGQWAEKIDLQAEVYAEAPVGPPRIVEMRYYLPVDPADEDLTVSIKGEEVIKGGWIGGPVDPSENSSHASHVYRPMTPEEKAREVAKGVPASYFMTPEEQAAEREEQRRQQADRLDRYTKEG